MPIHAPPQVARASKVSTSPCQERQRHGSPAVELKENLAEEAMNQGYDPVRRRYDSYQLPDQIGVPDEHLAIERIDGDV